MGDAAKAHCKQHWDTVGECSYLLDWTQCQTRYCIDASEEDGSFGRLINHTGKHPNISPYGQIISGTMQVLFRTIKNIEPGDELLWSYEQFQGGRPEWMKASSCPCSGCQKKRMVSFFLILILYFSMIVSKTSSVS